MKLTLESIKDRASWQGYHLPDYDPAKIAENTRKAPAWLHFGPGNIFRAFPTVLCQRLIEQGKMDTGIICCSGRSPETIVECLRPHDNLTIAVTMGADGSMDKEIVASVTDSLTMQYDLPRIQQIFEMPCLQMVSFTITEKGYALRGADGELMPAIAADMDRGPDECTEFMPRMAAMCLQRKKACGKPLSMVSMDNCSHNGEKFRSAILEIAGAWLQRGKITAEEYGYLENEIAFPWSMIDKITPRPNAAVEAELQKDGVEDASLFVTSKQSYVAPFVNAEKPQYLVIEDQFPNGRPPLEEAGVIFTTRETVDKVEKMKVSTCLNPLHTALSVFGCLLGYTLICEEMKDADLVNLVRLLGYKEGLPVVTNPGILNPREFLDEVVEQRLPNLFMPDAPQRIAMDTSQKVGVRFGVTVRSYLERGLEPAELVALPLAIAGWMRYLLAVDDTGKEMEVSPDPLKEELQGKLSDIIWNRPESYHGQLKEILSNVSIFGCDLVEAGLSDKIEGYFKEMLAGAGAVRATLHKYTGDK